MTPNGTTTESTPAGEATSPRGEAALFLETSAQFHRLTGPCSIRDSINEMIDSSDRVGTSWYVEREFNYVYGSFFDSVIRQIQKLSHLSRPRKLWDMWLEVEYQLRQYYSGGPKIYLWLVTTLSEALMEEFGNELVSPLQLRNKVIGRKEILLANFYKREDCFFDKSSCGAWDKSCSSRCDPEPDPKCRLKEIGVDMRSDFLASAEALSRSNCSESKWLRENLPRLEAAHGKALLDLMGEHRDYVSDIVIFWEVPDGWTILTRDRAFGVLQKAHRAALEVYALRLPREDSGKQCQVRPQEAPEAEGVLINYNAKGARVSADPAFVKRLRKRERVTISAKEFGTDEAPDLGYSRDGRVVYRDKKDESVFAVRFPSE